MFRLKKRTFCYIALHNENVSFKLRPFGMSLKKSPRGSVTRGGQCTRRHSTDVHFSKDYYFYNDFTIYDVIENSQFLITIKS